MKALSFSTKAMNPYDKAAFGFAKAYQMNMRAANEQRSANSPSDNAFTEEMMDEEKALNYYPSGMEPAPPADQYNQFGANEQEEEMAGANGNSVARAKAKVSKYLRG